MFLDATFWSGIGWTALTSVVTSSVVAGLLQVLLKARFDGQLARSLADINSRNAKELERTRGEAAREAERFKQRHALFAEKQSEAIMTLFEGFVDLQTEMLDLLNPSRLPEGQREQFDLIQARRFEMFAYFRKKRLLLSANLVQQAEHFLARFSSIEIRCRSQVFTASRHQRDEEPECKLYEEASLYLGDRLAEIENECRAILASDVVGSATTVALASRL